MRQMQAVRDRRRVAMRYRYDGQALAVALGDPALAWASGFLLRAAARRTAVVLDGLAALAAGLLAADVTAPAGFWWLAADAPSDPAGELARDRLNLDPVLHLGSTTADGTAGVLCVPVLRAAVSHAAAAGRDGQ
jgi:nicotinate-nucleotide--dimethylbenzimidazole phosphoribosyltransferase